MHSQFRSWTLQEQSKKSIIFSPALPKRSSVRKQNIVFQEALAIRSKSGAEIEKRSMQGGARVIVIVFIYTLLSIQEDTAGATAKTMIALVAELSFN
jgi:hypothetical protein